MPAATVARAVKVLEEAGAEFRTRGGRVYVSAPEREDAAKPEPEGDA